MVRSGVKILCRSWKNMLPGRDAYQEDQVTIAYDTMWEGTAKIAHKNCG
jgi:hypothetical protein